jgi:HAD superfamily 5'-nucleotidase-like hydrolase
LLTKLKYDPSFAIRGLTFDPHHGNLLKLDALSKVEVAFFGRKELKKATVNRLYGGTGMLTASQISQLRMMADLFCLGEACLIADLIHWLAQTNLTFVPSYIYNDVVQAVSDVHSQGLLYNAVLKNPSKFVDPPKHLASYFTKLRDAGKKTFILSNSPYRFIDGLLTEFYHAGWQKLFDIVVVEAKKPSFFQGDRPFRRVNPYTGRVDWAPVDRLPLPNDGLGNVVLNGNLKTFSELTGYRQVLYSGDHLETDAREPRRYGWRSAVLLPELEKDIEVQNSEAYRTMFVKLLEAKDFLSNVFRCKPNLSKEAKGAILRELSLEMDDLRKNLRLMFGSPFGSVFSSASSSSSYGLMLLRWADLYTSSLDSFALNPVDAFLSAGGTTRALPHDVRVVV